MGRIVTTELPFFVPPWHIDDCDAIHFLHREFCNLLLSSTNNFRSGHDCTITSSARSPRYFRLQADIAIWVLREVRVNAVLTRPGSTFARDSIGNSREELEVSRCSCDGFLRDSVGTLSSNKFSLNSCSQSGRSRDIPPCNSSSSSFLFVFSVPAGSCKGFPRNSALILPLLSIAGFSVPITESCDEDVEK